MFDPETLRTFIAVAETGSFSKAAERLCKTTATISYRIKLLEENTGVALFFRTTRSVTLTAAGEHLLSQARDWLSWLESMPSELQQVNDGVERQVNIVINNLLYNPQAVAQLLAWLNERYPFTQFHISRQIYMGVWDSLLYEGFSLAIGVTGTEALANTFSLDPLGSVQWRFVMAADHPLLRCAAERRPLPDGFPPAEKYSLIQSYTSQDPAAYNGYLLAFAKNDELVFRVERLPSRT